MALEFAHGAIQWLAADAATTVYTVSGLSFQPKALRFYWQGLGSAVDANSQTIHSRRGIGFAASTSDRRCVATQDQDAVGTSVCTSGVFDDAVVSTVTSTPARDGALDINSITSDGFTLIVDDQGPVDLTVFWEAWGGGEITAAETGRIQEPAAVGNQVIAGTFKPDVLMLAGVQVVGTGATIVTREASGLSLGFSAPNTIVVSGNADDGSPSADTDGFCFSTRVHAMMAPAGGNPTGLAGVIAFNPTGFTLNWNPVGVTDRNLIYLVIAGGQWAAGAYTIDGASAGATATVAGLPFAPIGLSLIGRMTVEQTIGPPVSTANDRISLGSGSSPSSRRTMGHLSEDGPTTIEIDLTVQYDQILAFPSTAGGLQSAYDLDAMLPDGFRVIVDTAGGVANEWQGYLTFGSMPSTWTQPVQGTRSLRTQNERLYAAAVAARFGWHEAFESAPFEEPSTWSQPVQGVGSLATHGRVFYDRAARALWPVHAFEAGPEPPAEAPWMQPVVGTAQLRRALDELTLQAIRAMGPAWPAEAVVAEEPSTWIQDVQGIVWLSRGHTDFWRAALEARVRRPDDTDGPLGDQPDTWIQPVVGTAAVHRALRDMWRRAMEAQGYSLIAAAPVSPVEGHNNLQPYLVVYMWRRTG